MKLSQTLFALGLLALLASGATGAEGNAPAPVLGQPNLCADCGCRKACRQKVCQVVCETKKVKKYCWCIETSEVGTLLPGHRFLGKSEGCGESCGPTGCDKTCDKTCEKTCEPKGPVPSRCDKIYTVKKLVKKEYECEVPVYKCVVKYTCNECGGGSGATAATPNAPKAAPAPAVPTGPATAPAAPKLPVPPKPAKTT